VTAVVGFFFIVLPAASAISLIRNLAGPVRFKANAEGLTICGSGGFFKSARRRTFSWPDLGVAELRTIGDMRGVYVNLTGGQSGLWLNLDGVETCPDVIVRAINRRILQSRPAVVA
jgi:hypothetical protein